MGLFDRFKKRFKKSSKEEISADEDSAEAKQAAEEGALRLVTRSEPDSVLDLEGLPDYTVEPAEALIWPAGQEVVAVDCELQLLLRVEVELAAANAPREAASDELRGDPLAPQVRGPPGPVQRVQEKR